MKDIMYARDSDEWIHSWMRWLKESTRINGNIIYAKRQLEHL